MTLGGPMMQILRMTVYVHVTQVIQETTAQSPLRAAALIATITGGRLISTSTTDVSAIATPDFMEMLAELSPFACEIQHKSEAPFWQHQAHRPSMAPTSLSSLKSPSDQLGTLLNPLITTIALVSILGLVTLLNPLI